MTAPDDRPATVRCPSCGGCGEQYEWCENIAVGLSECVMCNGTGCRPTESAATEETRDDNV